MKTCKKLLVGMLVFALMMSMCAFVSAEDTTETETPAVPYDLTVWTFDSLTAGKTFANAANINPDVKNISKALSLRKFSPTNNSNDTTAVADTVNGGNYIKTAHSRFGVNYNTNIESHITTSGNPVVSISYDIMIPGGTNAYKENLRYGFFAVGGTTAGGTTTTNTISPKIENGEISAGVSGTTNLYSKKLDYAYDEWVTLKSLFWQNDEGNLSFAVYADDTLIWYGKGETASPGMALSSNIDLRYYSDAANSVSSGTDGTSYTCYDNIKIQLLPESAKVTEDYVDDLIAKEELEKEEAEAATKAATPYIRLLEYTADTIHKNAGTSGNTVFTNTGDVFKNSLVQGANTDNHEAAAYAVVNDSDRTYTNVTSYSYKLLTAPIRESFDDYVQKQSDVTNTFVYSVDLNLKDFNAEIISSCGFGLDLSSNDTTAPDGSTIKARKTGDITLKFDIGTDGNISFSNSVAGYGSIVPGKERSESRAVPAGEWINVKYVTEVVHGAEQYNIKVYGIYEDDVIYVNEFALAYDDYDKDGVADDIHISAVSIDIGTNDKTHTETVTGIDNIYFEKNNNFDWTAVDTDNWTDRNVSLVLDADGNVDVEAKKGGDEAFTGGVLLIALYDAKGKIVELIKSTEITDGKFVYELPAAKVATAKKIKGFVFDGIATAVPQMKHGVFEIN